MHVNIKMRQDMALEIVNKRNIPSLGRLKQASLILLRCALCINGGVEYFVNYLGNGSHERGNYIMFPQKYFLKFDV